MTPGDALIERFVAGRYVDRATGRTVASPVRATAIAPSLAGHEAELVAGLGFGGWIAIVSDENTHDILGSRIERALPGSQGIVLHHPKANEENAAILSDLTRHADAVIAVGSGTVNDLCKYVTHKDGRECAVFATAPSMNGYVTGTASITREGFKLSLPAHAPAGVFYDLDVLAKAPKRMIRAGLGDAICRSSAQLDWLLSHLLLGTTYVDSAYDLQVDDEPLMIATAAAAVDGDISAVATLVRMLTLGGFGVSFTGTTHVGSMGEHSLSHYIDMFANPHPGTLHGEQVGVATRTMTRLQSELLATDALPALAATVIDEAAMRGRYGPNAAGAIAALRKKALDAAAASALSDRLASEWPAIRERLRALMLPLAALDATMVAAGIPMTAEAVGLDPAFWRGAVRHAHEIRDRWSFLDLAAGIGLLDSFAEGER